MFTIDRLAATAALAALLAAPLATPAAACDLLDGRTTYDSAATLVGDPFFGGKWSNARNGKAWILRVLKNPATVYGFYLGSAGSDVKTAGSTLRISARKPDGSLVVLYDLRGAAVNRAFSGSGTGIVTSPVTVTFPPVEVKSLRVDMTGNGWFLLYNLSFNVLGCS